MRRLRIRREVVAAVTALALAACSAASAGAPDTSAPSGTVGGVGVLPGDVPRVQSDETGEVEDTARGDSPDDTDVEDTEQDSTTSSTTRPGTSTTSSPDVPDELIGEQAAGNRVLMIGDSILASTSRRYGNTMCPAMVPLGWSVGVEAEVSRDITFGNRVLERRLSAGWDAALILLGNNYGMKPNLFMAELDKILLTLAPRPTVLLTVTEFEPAQAEVNDIIRAVAELYPNVTVFDWASASQSAGVLSADGLHLSDEGRAFLADQIAPLFGPAPEGPAEPGCLSATFHDDSEGLPNPPATTAPRPTVTTRPTGTTKPPSTAVVTTTTVRPATTTPGPTTTSPYDANPPSTVAPTSPPQTQPPQTQPPKTDPPQKTDPPSQTDPPPVTVTLPGP